MPPSDDDDDDGDDNDDDDDDDDNNNARLTLGPPVLVPPNGGGVLMGSSPLPWRTVTWHGVCLTFLKPHFLFIPAQKGPLLRSDFRGCPFLLSF